MNEIIKNNNHKIILNYIAILAVFIFSGAGTFMNAAVQTMIESWPQIPANEIRMITTIPSLVSLPAMLLAGRFVGSKIGYRTCLIAGTAIIAIAGVMPYFLNTSWSLILIFRVFLGIGVGMVSIRNSLLLLSIPKEKQAVYIGYGSVLMNLGAMIASPIVGMLTKYSWRHPFLFDGLALIPLLYMIFFLKEPEIIEEKSKETVEGKFGWRTYYYIGMQLLTTMITYPVLFGLSTYMAQKHIGTTVIVGMMLSLYNLAGMGFNVLLNQILKIGKRYTMTAMCLLAAIGLAGMIIYPSIPTILVGVILIGGSFNIMMSILQIYNGQILPAAKASFASTIILAMLQMGFFCSTFFVSISHKILHRATDVESGFIAAMFVYILLGIFSAIMKAAPEK